MSYCGFELEITGQTVFDNFWTKVVYSHFLLPLHLHIVTTSDFPSPFLLQMQISLLSAIGFCSGLCLSSQTASRGISEQCAHGHRALKTHLGLCLISRLGSVTLVCQYLPANILNSFQFLNADLEKCLSNTNETMWY